MAVDEVIGELIAALGPDRIRTDSRALDRYSHDAWPLQTKLELIGRHDCRPDVIVRVETVADVRDVLRIAATHRMPLTARGLGSSVTGQPLPTRGGIVLDLSRMAGEATIDETNLTVSVGAGWNGGELEKHLNAAGFTLGHSPQSLLRSTVGGWVATAATGQLSSRFGGIEDMVMSIDIVLADGSEATIGANPRAAVGPNLTGLFIGSEGTLGIVTRVTLRISALSAVNRYEAFRMADVPSMLTAIRTIAQSGQRPHLVRGYDRTEARHAVQNPDFDGCVVFLGNQGVDKVAEAEHSWQADIVRSLGGVSLGANPVEQWLTRRYDFSTVEHHLALPGGYAETIEVAHTWSEIQGLYERLREALLPLAEEVNGHFSHIYPQGTSLYLILFGMADDDAAAVERLKDIWSVAMTTTLAAGGVLSHHHGAGLARAPYIEQALGSSLNVLRRVKGALDPDGILNPGKLALATGRTQ